MLSATGRKFLRGRAAPASSTSGTSSSSGSSRRSSTCTRPSGSTPDTFTIRADARRFENWETSYATKLGLGAAVDYALGWGLAEIAERVQGLAASTCASSARRLAGVRGARPRRAEKCGIVTFTAAGVSAKEIGVAPPAARVNVSVTPVTYSRLDLGARGLDAVVRASVHYYNTEAEVGRLVELVGGMAA